MSLSASCKTHRYEAQSLCAADVQMISSVLPASLQFRALLAAYMNKASPNNTKAPPGDNPMVTADVQQLILWTRSHLRMYCVKKHTARQDFLFTSSSVYDSAVRSAHAA